MKKLDVITFVVAVIIGAIWQIALVIIIFSSKNIFVFDIREKF